MSSISVPCIVNSWLYCSLLRNCRPGRASSVRISSAMMPAIRKNTNDVDQVEVADDLVVGAGDPAHDPAAGYDVDPLRAEPSTGSIDGGHGGRPT